MAKVLVTVMASLVLWLIVPVQLFAAKVQPDEPLFVCGQDIPGFVVDATGIQLTSEHEALQYLATQTFANVTRLGMLYHALAQLRLRGVQYRIWTDGGEYSDSVGKFLGEFQD
jgi:hypothetical protein